MNEFIFPHTLFREAADLHLNTFQKDFYESLNYILPVIL